MASFWRKHKQNLSLGIALFFVALISFGFGYLVAQDAEHTPIIIEKNLEK